MGNAFSKIPKNAAALQFRRQGILRHARGGSNAAFFKLSMNRHRFVQLDRKTSTTPRPIPRQPIRFYRLLGADFSQSKARKGALAEARCHGGRTENASSGENRTDDSPLNRPISPKSPKGPSSPTIATKFGFLRLLDRLSHLPQRFHESL
jgi:hypothetical protein